MKQSTIKGYKITWRQFISLPLQYLYGIDLSFGNIFKTKNKITNNTKTYFTKPLHRVFLHFLYLKMKPSCISSTILDNAYKLASKIFTCAVDMTRCRSKWRIIYHHWLMLIEMLKICHSRIIRIDLVRWYRVMIHRYIIIMLSSY